MKERLNRVYEDMKDYIGGAYQKAISVGAVAAIGLAAILSQGSANAGDIGEYANIEQLKKLDLSSLRDRSSEESNLDYSSDCFVCFNCFNHCKCSK